MADTSTRPTLQLIRKRGVAVVWPGMRTGFRFPWQTPKYSWIHRHLPRPSQDMKVTRSRVNLDANLLASPAITLPSTSLRITSVLWIRAEIPIMVDGRSCLVNPPQSANLRISRHVTMSTSSPANSKYVLRHPRVTVRVTREDSRTLLNFPL